MTRLFHHTRLVLPIAALVITRSAFAEVMDKEPTLLEVWACGIVGAVIGLALPSFRWWLVFVALPVSVFLPLGTVVECYDEFVGPAIVREAGHSYVLHCHLALASVIAANALGVVLGVRRRSRRRNPRASAA